MKSISEIILENSKKDNGIKYIMPHKFSFITLEEFCELNCINESQISDSQISYFYENYGKKQGLPASHYDASHTHNDWIIENFKSHDCNIVIRRIKELLGDKLLSINDKKLSEKGFESRIVRIAISKQCHILDSNSTETFELNKNSKWSKEIYDILRFHNYYITLIYEYSHEDVIIIEPKQTQNATEFVKNSHYVYHVTFKENVKDILRKGLRPKAKKMKDENRYRYYTDRIFLIADSPDLIDDINRVINDIHAVDNYAILKIDISKLNITYWWDDASVGNTIYTIESIPPKFIEIFDNINDIKQ